MGQCDWFSRLAMQSQSSPGECWNCGSCIGVGIFRRAISLQLFAGPFPTATEALTKVTYPKALRQYFVVLDRLQPQNELKCSPGIAVDVAFQDTKVGRLELSSKSRLQDEAGH